MTNNHSDQKEGDILGHIFASANSAAHDQTAFHSSTNYKYDGFETNLNNLARYLKNWIVLSGFLGIVSLQETPSCRAAWASKLRQV